MTQIIAPTFGNGKDGVKVITATEDINARTGVSGTNNAGQKIINVDDGSVVAVGDLIMVHQTRGTGFWNHEFRRVASKAGNVLTLDQNLDNTYTDDGGTNQAQVIRIPEYSSFTITNTGVLRPAAWNGNVGGISWWACNGKGVIQSGGLWDWNGLGFDGGRDESSIGNTQAETGESPSGGRVQQTSANGMGGGGARDNGGGNGASGGGGGHAVAGASGGQTGPQNLGAAGNAASDSNDGIKMGIGGAGGGGIGPGGNDNGGYGGDSAGFGGCFCWDFDCSTGSISGRGENGNTDGNVGGSQGSGGGGGSGGSFKGIFGNANIGTDRIDLSGGAGGGSNNPGTNPAGGAGSKGRARIEACSLTGSIGSTLADISTVVGGRNWCGASTIMM